MGFSTHKLLFWLALLFLAIGVILLVAAVIYFGIVQRTDTWFYCLFGFGAGFIILGILLFFMKLLIPVNVANNNYYLTAHSAQQMYSITDTKQLCPETRYQSVERPVVLEGYQ